MTTTDYTDETDYLLTTNLTNYTNMENKEEWQTADAKEAKQLSEYIKMVTDFAQYVQKEYIDDSDGEMSLMICASDRTISGSKTAAAHIILGGRYALTTGLASMMKDERIKYLMSSARVLAAEMGDINERIKERKSRLRKFYYQSALCGVWTLVLIVLYVSGMTNLITTISNLLLMALCGFLNYREIKECRRRIEVLKREEEQDKKEQALFGFQSFMEMLKRHAQQNDDDENE